MSATTWGLSAVLAGIFCIGLFILPSPKHQEINQPSKVDSSANRQEKMDGKPEQKMEIPLEQRIEESAKSLKDIQHLYASVVEVATQGAKFLNWDLTKESNAVRREEIENTIKARRPEIESNMKKFEAAIDEFFANFDKPFTEWTLFVLSIKIVDNVAQIETIAKSIDGNNLTFVFIDEENKLRAKIADLETADFAKFSGKPTGRFKKEALSYTAFFTLDDVKQQSLKRLVEESKKSTKAYEDKKRKDRTDQNK